LGIEGQRDVAGETRGQEEARWSEWMCRANAGDAEIYARLLTDVAGVMEQYLRRRFGDSDFVEDCVQECLLSIHRARATYDPSRQFRSWMFTIVRHKAIDMLRRRGTRQRHETPEARSEEAAAPATEPVAALQAAQALAAIRSEYRDALVMTKLQGHSLAEVARLTGVSVTAVKSRVHRGIQEVRRLLEREED
jgi:RNA polymerase sigma-70 factor (ECF subfamily)